MCIKSKVKTITICGHIYKFQYQNNNKYSYYFCDKRKSEACQGQVILSPNGTIVKQSNHSCKLPDTCNTSKNKNHPITTKFRKSREITKIDGHFYHFCREYKTKNKYYLCAKRLKVNCRGSITISPDGQLIRRVEHDCSKTCQETNLMEIDTANDYSTPKGSIDKKRDYSISFISKLVKIEETQEENTTVADILQLSKRLNTS